MQRLDMVGNETLRTALVEVTAFNSIIPIPAFTLPASEQTSEVSETSEVSPAPEANFGGTVNVIPAGQSSTTTTNGESVLQGVSVQTGFSAGNQSASLPIANPNLLWGAAAAALLGMTLAEWQRQREEEAKRLAALRNSGGGGGSDEEEIPSDVLAKRRAKVIAKNEAKRAKEHLWEAARQAKAAQKDEETFMRRTYKKIVDAANVIPNLSARRGRQEEQARQENDDNRANAAYAARWAGLASVWQGKQESKDKQNGGDSGKPLAKLLGQIGTLISTIAPTYTSTINPTSTPKPTSTPTATYTPTYIGTPASRTPLPTPTSPNIDTAESYLQYSPQGLSLYNQLKSKYKVEINYRNDADAYGSLDFCGPKPYFFGLIKIKTAIISVNPLSSPTMIAGTLAHEGYHCLTPGNTQLEEYNAFRIGDEVRYDIIQAGYGNVNTDMRFPLSEYNINTSNPNLGQLIQDLNTWFNTPPHRMPKYVLPAAQGGYDMTPLPTMPTATLPPTSTPSFTQTPTSTQTQTPTPTSTPKPNQIGENQ